MGKDECSRKRADHVQVSINCSVMTELVIALEID